VFILPGIIPFVPGATIYKTMENILYGEFSSATLNGTESFATAGSIAVALILIASIVRLITAVARRIKGLLSKGNMPLAASEEFEPIGEPAEHEMSEPTTKGTLEESKTSGESDEFEMSESPEPTTPGTFEESKTSGEPDEFEISEMNESAAPAEPEES
jgi:hypothetical protein